jgi:hypothetical protein
LLIISSIKDLLKKLYKLNWDFSRHCSFVVSKLLATAAWFKTSKALKLYTLNWDFAHRRCFVVSKLLATAGNCWQLLATAGNCWQLLATAGNCWQLLVTATWPAIS